MIFCCFHPNFSSSCVNISLESWQFTRCLFLCRSKRNCNGEFLQMGWNLYCICLNWEIVAKSFQWTLFGFLWLITIDPHFHIRFLLAYRVLSYSKRKCFRQEIAVKVLWVCWKVQVCWEQGVGTRDGGSWKVWAPAGDRWIECWDTAETFSLIFIIWEPPWLLFPTSSVYFYQL